MLSLERFFEPDWFSKICLAKILVTINFGTQLVGIQKISPPHKVLAKILPKKKLPIFWPALVLAKFWNQTNQTHYVDKNIAYH